jgi:tellurite resistance protein
MGFLDRMVSDLVRRQTGFDARRIVRRIGGRRLLMLGGAALVGGMMASQSGRFGGGSTAGGDASGRTTVPPRASGAGAPSRGPLPSGLPPLPPLPALDDALPPLPGSAALADAADTVADVPPDLLYAILRTMIAAALADGELHAEEKRLIDERLGESGLPEAQLAQLRRDLVIPARPVDLAQALPSGEDPEVLARFAVLIAAADGELVEHERVWLRSLEQALVLPAGRTAELEREIFPLP